MMERRSLRSFFSRLNTFILLGVIYADSFASTTGLPWEGPLQKIANSITGPVAKIIGVIIIFAAGISLAIGEAGAGMRRLLQVVLGLSVAFTASSFIMSMFGFSGGTVF